jgi:hypothetical protein
MLVSYAKSIVRDRGLGEQRCVNAMASAERAGAQGRAPCAPDVIARESRVFCAESQRNRAARLVLRGATVPRDRRNEPMEETEMRKACVVLLTSVALGCGPTIAGDAIDEVPSASLCIPGNCPTPKPGGSGTGSPAPSVWRVTVPPSYFQDAMSLALSGVRVQLSQDYLDPSKALLIPEFTRACIDDPRIPDVGARREECKADCAGTDKRCRGACDNQFLICKTDHSGCDPAHPDPNDFCIPQTCVRTPEWSFIDWNEIVNLTTPPASAAPNCDWSKCPACDPPARVPTLRDSPIYIPSIEYDVGPFDHITCFINLIRFDFSTSSMSTYADNDGLHLRVNGWSGQPTIHCEGFTDINVFNIWAEMVFVPHVSAGALSMTPTGRFDADFRALNNLEQVLVDIISGRIRGEAGGYFSNAVAGQASLFSKKFDDIIRLYVQGIAPPAAQIAYYTAAYVGPNGITVEYVPKGSIGRPGGGGA